MYARFAMNYASAALLAFLAMPVKAFPQTGYGSALGLGAAQGVMYLLTLVILQANIRKNGVILSATFARLGLIVPMGLRWRPSGRFPPGCRCWDFCWPAAPSGCCGPVSPGKLPAGQPVDPAAVQRTDRQPGQNL